LNRNEIKSIVKECLLEILMEGVKGSSQRIEENRQPKRAQPVTETRRSPLDTVTYAQRTTSVPKPPQNRPAPNPVQKESYKELANGSDVMASIFADTASTTLVEQRETGRSGMASQVSANPVIDTGVDPNLMEGSNNWALLAFSDKRPVR
jgi:hypothetical protein